MRGWPFFYALSLHNNRYGIDISSIVNDMGSRSSDRDFFVDLSPAAEYIYTMMISFRDQETIPVISINPSLAWLNIRLSYRIEGSIDPDTFEKGMHQFKLLAVRVEEVGGKFEIVREDIPVISHKILAGKVERTSNNLARNALAQLHLRRMYDAYNDDYDHDEAFFHADLFYRYNPEPNMKDSNNVGYVLLSADDFDRAEAFFKRSIILSNNMEVDDKIWPALPIYNLGVVKIERGQLESALIEFKSCISLVQDLNQNDRSLSYLWIPEIDDGTINLMEQKSPDLLTAAEMAKTAIECILSQRNID